MSYIEYCRRRLNAEFRMFQALGDLDGMELTLSRLWRLAALAEARAIEHVVADTEIPDDISDLFYE